MFGQGARLPIDLLLRGDEEVDENQSDWLAEHQARLTDAYQRAEEHLKQQAEKRQDQHLERVQHPNSERSTSVPKKSSTWA